MAETIAGRASRPAVVFDRDAVADRAAIESALGRIADQWTMTMVPPVRDVVRYALAGEGKRLRALLLLWSYRAAGGVGDAAPLAASVEVVHAYSLVHDDLPCMDDDDVRRGRPTAHRAFDVRAATAAGLAMVPLAARAVLEGARTIELPAPAAAAILRVLMGAAGAGGMIGGQLNDLEGEGRPLSLVELERVHRGKTGALIAASARIGGLAAQAQPSRVEALASYGAAVGLAFQIADDVLDVTSTTAELGKTAGKDLIVRKSTYPALLGIDGAKERARALVSDACRALSHEGLLTPPLEELARFAVERRS
jgi:farnesyl diphosphate synthase/geranylgeranyl diphosphate synthase type II